jgi:Fe-S-cluster containining protein
MDSTCSKCDARCCRYFCFEIDKPDTYEEFENIRWYLLHENISVHIDCEGDWCIMIDSPCRLLVKTPTGWRCGNYDNRPIICRKYSPDNCDRTKGGYDYEEMFETSDQLEAYARRMLGDHAFEESSKRLRKKAQASGKEKKTTRKPASKTTKTKKTKKTKPKRK